MKNKEQKIQIIKEVLLKYLLPDSLKPEYDGMSAYEVASIMLREIESEEEIELKKPEFLKTEEELKSKMDSGLATVEETNATLTGFESCYFCGESTNSRGLDEEGRDIPLCENCNNKSHDEENL